MGTIRDDLLPVVDSLRALPAQFGLRRYTVTLRRRVWSGGKVGLGTSTDTDVLITPTPKVREVTTHEVSDSAGMWRSGDLKIDKITPNYTSPTTGGWTPSQLNIRPSAANEDVCIILTGDEGTMECQLVEIHFERAFTYWFIARRSIVVRG